MSELFTDVIEAKVGWSVRQQTIQDGLMSQWISVSQFLPVLVGNWNVKTKMTDLFHLMICFRHRGMFAKITAYPERDAPILANKSLHRAFCII